MKKKSGLLCPWRPHVSWSEILSEQETIPDNRNVNGTHAVRQSRRLLLAHRKMDISNAYVPELAMYKLPIFVLDIPRSATTFAHGNRTGRLTKTL